MVSLSWLIGGICSVPMVAGHGFMVIPKVRNIAKGKYRYEPQSVGAVGPGGDITICGKGADNFQVDDEVTELPAPGSKFTIKAKITAHHYGHMIVRVCQFIDSKTTHRDLKTKCIRLHDVKSKDVWPLSANPGDKYWEVTLPTKSELVGLGTNGYEGVYTIQWRWNTGNSCNPSERVEKEDTNCNEWKCCSEVFTNCADVVFKGLAFVPPKAPVNPPKPRPVPAPAAGGGGGGTGGSGCQHETDIKKSRWAADTTMVAWCAARNKEDCDEAEQCRWGGGNSPRPEPEPEPEPEGEPHVAHVSIPTSAATKAGKAKQLLGVREFCARNKEYFCRVDPYPALGNDICECEPVGDEPEPEPESGPEPESSPRPEPEPDSENPKPCKDGVKVTKNSQCNHFKGWCQKFCKGAVATNQCWGRIPHTECVCFGQNKEKVVRTNCYPGDSDLLQLEEPSQLGTKFADRITRQIGVHGEVRP